VQIVEHGVAAARDEQAKRGMSLGDGVVALGTAVTLLAVLLPWWDTGLGVTANGLHDWGWLSFFALLLVATLLLARRLVGQRLRLSVSDGVAYMLGGAMEMAGAGVFWAVNNTRIPGAVRYGVFIGVVGGAITLVGGWLGQMDAD
jgi:hypothetical protein